jgi:hypothetical protein
MIGKPKDYRPKIISYPLALQGLNIASSKSILWPCHAYTMSIPKTKHKLLNILEDTVFKLIEADSGNSERIAYLTGLDQELIVFIKNRLYQLGLIDKHNNITDVGDELINEWRNKESKDMEYAVATIFVDLISGKIIPFISTDPLSFRKIIDISKNLVVFQNHPTNKKARIWAHQIMPSKDSFWTSVPDYDEIIRAIREYKKKYRRYAILSNNKHQYPQSIPKAEAITLNDEPELVYLHCMAFIQKGNSELIVTDGTGLGFSEQFSKYLTEQNLEWVIELKKSGIIEYLESKESDDEERNSHDILNYPEVTKKIEKVRTSVKRLDELSLTTTAEEKEYRKTKNHIVSQMYAAMEWAFRLTLGEYPVHDWENFYFMDSYRANEKILIEYARKVGFRLTKESRSLLKVNSGAIHQIELGKVELQPLLVLLITGAAMEYSGHPLNSIAVEDSDFLTYLYRLKKLRDPVEHGDTNDYNKDVMELKEMVRYLTSMIMLLLPRISTEICESKSGKKSYHDPNQERLKARTVLDEMLGQSFVLKLPMNLIEQLIRCEMLMQKFTSDRSLEIIKCLYSSMQLMFVDLTQNRRFEYELNDNINTLALKKMVDFGFFSSIAAVPSEIRTVNIQRILIALQGKGSSLGAQLLAFIILCSEEELAEINKTSPSFIDITAQLIKIRGHGNLEIESVSYNELLDFKKNIYTHIKNIMEVS